MVHWTREWQTTSVFLPQKPHEQYKRQKDMTPKVDPPRWEDVQYATEEERQNSFRKNKEAGPKWKCLSAVDVSHDESKVQCY